MIEIRELTVSDVTKGFLTTLTALSPTHLTASQFSNILTNRNRHGIRTFVAVLEDEIVGTISFFIEMKFIHSGGKVCHIEDVAVREDLQISGIGTSLMEFVENIAKQENCYKMILDCGDYNVRFYQKNGYREHEICMRKDL